MDIIVALYIFVLAAVTAYALFSKAPISLHTPLLSVSSFTNSIILIGAMIVMANAETSLQTAIAFIAIVLAAANAVGGYVIVSRVSSVFSKNKAGGK